MAMEKNAKRKIRLRVAGNDLTVVSSESEEYSRALASKMDKEIKNICRTTVTSVMGAALLSALNYCDGMQKAEAEAEELRKQLSACQEEIAALKAAADEIKSENEKLRTEADNLRAGLQAMTMAVTGAQQNPASSPFRSRFAADLNDARGSEFSYGRVSEPDVFDRRDRRTRRDKRDKK